MKRAMVGANVLLGLVGAILPLHNTASAGWLFGPSSYHECLLEELEGKTDDNEAMQATIDCRNRFSPMAPEERINPGLLGTQNLRECVEKLVPATSSAFAVGQLQDACLSLYPDTGEASELP